MERLLLGSQFYKDSIYTILDNIRINRLIREAVLDLKKCYRDIYIALLKLNK